MFCERNVRILFLCLFTCLSIVFAGCGTQSTIGSHGGSSFNETLIWSDEFNPSEGVNQPSSTNWSYRTGIGNGSELEIYCGKASASPCDSEQPNAFSDNDGFLHIAARRVASNSYTSAMIWTQGLQSFQYGRMEARMKLPSVAGFWPAFWMLGNNFNQYDQSTWPECGEIDVMETHALSPVTVLGSIHGLGFVGQQIVHKYSMLANSTISSEFHSYGILWSPKKIEFYIDDPSNIYSSVTPESLPQGAVWPFDGQKFFFVLNMSVWSPASSSQEEMLVDYVRVWREETAD